MFDIRLDRARGFLHVVAAGFWDLHVLERYDRALRAALSELKTLPGPSRCLIDTREFGIQARGLGPRFSEHLSAVQPLWPDRVAQLVTSAIVKLQAQRSTAAWHSHPTYFTSEAEARAWLFEAAGGAIAA